MKVEIQDVANAATTSTAAVYLHITPGSIGPGEAGATLSCTANPVAAVAGVATFVGCHIDRAGTFTLTAEDPVDGLAKESVPITIDPAAADGLAFTTQPGYGTQGADLTTQPKVSVQDAFGNTVTSGGPWDITLTIQNGTSPGGGLLDCDPDNIEPTDTTGTNPRTATFSTCDVSVAGTGYTLGATSNPVLSPATSAAFNVSAATATALAFVTQPSSVQPATAMGAPFEVAFVDGAGRIVATDANTIAVTRTPAVGALSGCVYSATTNGVVTVSACQISLPGVFQLVADQSSGPDLPTVTSNAFTVGILHLAFLTQPGNGTAGNPLSSQPVIAVQNASNQIVASTSAIDLHIAPGTGSPGATLTCDTNPLAPAPPSVLAVFALCKVDLPGVGYRITATNTTLGLSIDSATFNVVGPAVKLVFATQPSDGYAGSAAPHPAGRPDPRRSEPAGDHRQHDRGHPREDRHHARVRRSGHADLCAEDCRRRHRGVHQLLDQPGGHRLPAHRHERSGPDAGDQRRFRHRGPPAALGRRCDRHIDRRVDAGVPR